MSASRDDLRWAARFGFVDELWRDRARIVFDPALEAVLVHERLEGDAVQGALDLLDALLPPTATDGVWMVVSNAETAARLRRQRPGTTFLPREGMMDLLQRADWDVALVDLAALLVDGEHELLAALGRGVEQGRAVVLSARGVTTAADDEQRFDYGEVADVLAEDLGGGRIYGLYDPPMAAVVDFGERIEGFATLDAELDEEADELDEIDEIEDADDVDEDAEGDWSERTGSIELPVRPGEDELELDADDDVPLVYDNTLGSQEPEFSYYLGVAGAELAAEGLTLVELPPATDSAGSEAESDALRSMRAQLTQARRRADLAVIDRQTQLERIDALEVENEQLRGDVTDLRDRLARMVEPGRAEVDEPSHAESAEDRLDAALAREQALRWRVTQLERERDALIGRPVDALQAEVASLRAQLQDAGSDEDPSGGSGANEPDLGGSADPGVGSAPNGVSEGRAIDTAPFGAVRRPVNGHRTEIVVTPTKQAVVRAVEQLVRRVERGGIGTLELRRQLVALRRRLVR